MMLVAALSAWICLSASACSASPAVDGARDPLHMTAPAIGPGQSPPDTAPDRWFAEDKLKHFFTSYAVTAMAFGGARATGIGETVAIPLAGFAALVAGIGKELSDRSRGGPFSFRDLAWDGVGIAAGLALAAGTR